MSSFRESAEYGKRTVETSSVDLPRLYHVWISAEGEKSEPQYFKGLQELAKHLEISHIIDIETLVQEGKHKSHPTYVMETMDKKAQELDYENNKDVYYPCIVVDRDSNNFSQEQLDEIVNQCDSKEYRLVLSNPNFDLWLLMHLVEIATYSEEEILKNKRISTKKRFVDSEVGKHSVPEGYRGKKVDFEKFVNHIGYAIRQSKEYATTFPELNNHMGSQIGLLVEKLFEGHIIKLGDSPSQG